ncbi:MAG: FadR family transcriptional regulator [Bradyrhizobium sp.]|nr:MAG: FadR family transcriptional regulator [Bradyrhizobium sp.]
MPFQPIDSRRLYEQVADQIGDLIRAGEFAAGGRLPAERDLAKTLGVSRPVVREALVALEIAGLVEVRTGSGAFVLERRIEPPPRVNAGDGPTDILTARMLIEGEIAALAAEIASRDDVARLAAFIDQMTADHDAGRPWSAADLGFHVAIASATGNAALATVVERLWQEQHAPVFSILSQRTHLEANWAETLRGHQAILAAIGAGKAEDAREAMRAHLRQVLGVVVGDNGGERY